jgi:hypothetical protein
VAYSPEATLALIASAISVGSVMLNCWVVRMQISVAIGLNPTPSEIPCQPPQAHPRGTFPSEALHGRVDTSSWFTDIAAHDRSNRKLNAP